MNFRMASTGRGELGPGPMTSPFPTTTGNNRVLSWIDAAHTYSAVDQNSQQQTKKNTQTRRSNFDLINTVNRNQHNQHIAIKLYIVLQADQPEGVEHNIKGGV